MCVGGGGFLLVTSQYYTIIINIIIYYYSRQLTMLTVILFKSQQSVHDVYVCFAFEKIVLSVKCPSSNS